jgi:exonuclease SbcC
MGPVDFKNTIYAGQKDLLTLLENTPGKRKEWFLRALGIDYLKTESDTILKERIDTSDREQKLLEGEIKALTGRQDADEFTALQTSVIELDKTLQSLVTQYNNTIEKKKNIDEEIRQLDHQKIEYTKLHTRFQSGEGEVRILNGQRTQISAKLGELAKAEPEFQALKMQVAIIPEKKKQFELLRKQRDDANRLKTDERNTGQKIADLKVIEDKARTKLHGFDQAAVKITNLIGEIAKVLNLGPDVTAAVIEPTITAYDEKIQHATATHSEQQKQLQARRKKLLNDFDTIKTAGPEGTCPLCRQKLGTHFMEIGKEFETKIKEIEEEELKILGEQKRTTTEKTKLASIKPALSEIRSLDAKLKQRPEVEADLKEIRNQIATQIQAQQIITAKIAELAFDDSLHNATEKEIKELEKIEHKFNDLREKRAEVTHLQKQLLNLEAQVRDKTEELEKLKTEISRSPYDEKNGAALEQKRKAIETAINNINTDSARTTERLKNAEDKIKKYKEAESEIAGLKKREEGLKDKIELLILTRKVIADYVIYLMQVVRSRIEGEVSRIIGEITGGRYEQVLLDEDFNLLVRDIDNDYSIERFSGGEQDDIAVALRIALSRYLAELHQVHESTILIFDEIFGSQDEERRNSLLTTLRTQESRFPQIILISHIPEMQGEFANTLVVEMGSDMVSRVKEVGD